MIVKFTSRISRQICSIHELLVTAHCKITYTGETSLRGYALVKSQLNDP